MEDKSSSKSSFFFFFFVWTTSLGKILTMEFEKMLVITLDWCCMCTKNGESIDHLLLHCDVARILWDEFFCWRIGLSRVMPQAGGFSSKLKRPPR